MSRAVAFLCLALLPALAITPTAEAVPDLPFCVGYESCYKYGGSFSFVCVKYKESWVCGKCEACGNEPWLP